MEISELIATRRKARGMSQTRLAERLGELSGRPTVTKDEVSRWERGVRRPTSWLPWLAAALDVPIAQLEQAKADASAQVVPPIVSGPYLDFHELADRLADHEAQNVLDGPWTPAGTLGAIAAVARGAAMDRREFLIAAGAGPDRPGHKLGRRPRQQHPRGGD